MLKLSHRLENSVCVVALDGQLKMAGVAALESYLRPFLDDRKIQGILLNFDKVDLIDSSGIGLMISIRKTLQSRQAELALCGLSDRLERMLSIVGITSIFSIFPNELEALQFFAK